MTASFQQILLWKNETLTLKAPITTAADDILKYFFNFSKKTSLDISCESSAWQTIHMKGQDLFSLKNYKNKNKTISQYFVHKLLPVPDN